MSCRLWCDEDHQPYYELVCDGCGASFTCYDDSCYDWRLLHDVALYAGWDSACGQPNGPHHCPSCQRTHRNRATRLSPEVPPAFSENFDHGSDQEVPG